MQDEGEGEVEEGDEKRETLPLHTPGHVATVRDVVWLDGGLMLTGGNDGKLCVWSSDPHFRTTRPHSTPHEQPQGRGHGHADIIDANRAICCLCKG